MSLTGLNRKEGENRQEHDFYATHPTAIPPLLKLLAWEQGGKNIWENSCGQGHLSIMLECAGHRVISTDLIDRGYGVSGVDFLQPTIFEHFNFDAVVMNPPYSHAIQFVEKSIKVAPIVCAFLRITFLESRKRREFFDNSPPKIVAVFSDRIPSSKDAKFSPKESSSVCYAWFIWDRDYKGETVLKWI